VADLAVHLADELNLVDLPTSSAIAPRACLNSSILITAAPHCASCGHGRVDAQIGERLLVWLLMVPMVTPSIRAVSASVMSS
jgi:hypothetical protein